MKATNQNSIDDQNTQSDNRISMKDLSHTTSAPLSIAVLIPCYNEEKTVKTVIEAFRKELPHAQIIVGDNNSTDRTAEIAKQTGARVIHVHRQGKGAVVRRLFREVQADYYIMVDGDDTYPAHQVHDLLRPVLDGRADMSVGDRMSQGHYLRENKRPFHTIGNRLVIGLINLLFRSHLTDILSGYRAFNRRFVKNTPILVDGFTVETVMTLHALDKLFSVTEVPVHYQDRPAGSHSKLSTFKDGFRVLRSILWIFKDNKPLLFFLILSLVFIILGACALLIQHHAYSTWISGISILSGLLFLVCGFVLDTLVKIQREDYEVTLMQQITSETNHES